MNEKVNRTFPVKTYQKRSKIYSKLNNKQQTLANNRNMQKLNSSMSSITNKNCKIIIFFSMVIGTLFI